MKKRMRLLVAYDGSSCADAALEDVRRAGLPDASNVLVLSVADVLLPPPAGAAVESDPEWLVAGIDEARARAAHAVEEAHTMALTASRRLRAEHPTWEVRAEACANSPAWAIIDKAGEWKADLVVLGACGHSGLRRLVLGSVSQRVVSDAPCSVRVARSRTAKSQSPVRLIVGIDGSADSEMALQQVLVRAWPRGSRIRVVTAIDSMMSMSVSTVLDTPSAGSRESRDVDTKAWVSKMHRAAAAKLESVGFAGSFLVKEGDPKEILVKEAKRWKADCVFVSAKGLRGVKQFLLGSVATAVTARASCSVEVVRNTRQEVSLRT